MLDISHTYVLDKALRSVHKKAYTPNNFLAVLGNIIPDYIDYRMYLKEYEDQKKAHDLLRIKGLEKKDFLAYGILFHLMSDNFSLIGKTEYDGEYPKDENGGFVSKLSEKVDSNLPPDFLKRRVIQCGLDIKILEDQHRKERVAGLLSATNVFISTDSNYKRILRDLNYIYNPDIEEGFIEDGLKMFLDIYRTENVNIWTNRGFRLRSMAKELKLIEGKEPIDEILTKIEKNISLHEIMEKNMYLLENWENQLNSVKEAVINDMKDTPLFSRDIRA